ncbi:MAG TPA: ASKHA domain-containing protein, partial [Anaerolinea sp.]|nr:ASKHA domain-containing protein [Anaerolinea sp.]
MAKKYTVTLQPIGRRIEVDANTSLLEAAQRAGVEMVASCGGIGICSTCKIRVPQGRVSDLTETEVEELGPEQVAAGYRLACQTYPLEDVRVDIPRESLVAGQQIQVEGQEGQIQLDPAVRAVDLDLNAPSLHDLRSDITRVNVALAQQGLPALWAGPGLLDALSNHLRRGGWRARIAVRVDEGRSALVSVLPYGARIAGLAMDMGSTKLAIFLVDLEDGAILAQAGVMNPQISFGEDVVSRIAFANRGEENRRQLQARLAEAVNQTLAEFCEREGICQEQVVDVVAVGNTAMHHLFSGLPVEPLGEAPYTPVVSEAMYFPAAEVGLRVAPGAWVYLPPNIAGYVGADHVSALLATRSYTAAGRTAMVVDIGTNTEISLMHAGRVLSCSCASGPAFEGAHIRDGMRAAPGAIERVHIGADTVRPVTIASQPPVGICGSGILNAVAELLDANILDGRGVLRPSDSRVRQANGKGEFLLVPSSQAGHGRDIVVTRKDVNEIQLAKGAIRAGLEILLKEAGISAGEVDDFIVAGALRPHLDLARGLRGG